MSYMEDVLAVILGGGRGTRLFPLTRMRSKPAVPFAGKYRLIDISISNCINSGIYRVAVLTQYNSVSLHRHIARTYNFDSFHTGWVQVLAAEQTPLHEDWYQGTADAVRKQLGQIRSTRAPLVMILSGDHLYRMDYTSMVEFHMETDADISVAVHPVTAADASRFGILKRDTNLRIRYFAEKPKDPSVLAEMISRNDPQRPYLGSMGVYLFKTPVLMEVLGMTGASDFGTEVIPQAIYSHKVFGFDFDGYWEDIGTIRTFYETNLALTSANAPFNFYDPRRPIYTHPRFLPGSILEDSDLQDVLLADGCRIHGARIRNSVVGLRSRIASRAEIRNSVILGADYYDIPGAEFPRGVQLGIGADSRIEGAIIDKNVRIGSGVVIQPFPPGTHLDGEGGQWYVREGVVVIPKDTMIQPHTTIGPDTQLSFIQT
ncbi:MAG: glucose-1-phosphate adenylyltransferase [Anaerolineales bacterium]|nr:glucose-1-phosphate adenylyltransferase [Anaerolineales bacterium]